MKVACLSNISVGYGTPQIVYFTQSLGRLAGDARPLLIESDQPERPPRHGQFSDVDIRRVASPHHPFSRMGQIRYLNAARDLLDAARPDILLLPSTYCLPVLWLMRHRPAIVIYYVLEMPDAFGFTREEFRLNLYARDRIDLAIYPEPNRAKVHIDTFGLHDVPGLVLYNAPPLGSPPPLPAAERNRRLLYQGTIHEELTRGDFFLDDVVQTLPIDLYGIVDSQVDEFRDGIIKGRKGVRYRGYVDNASLQAIRRRYHFSIVYWSPINDNQKFACPNKFFESIADGVPPITAPHPQCRMLTERYGLGLVMDDWSLESFTRSLEQAVEMIGSSRYDEMVRACRAAYDKELNWECQFEKVERLLVRMGVREGVLRKIDLLSGLGGPTAA
jgi:glycosyltransferase involved in cell wall biosynthesis